MRNQTGLTFTPELAENVFSLLSSTNISGLNKGLRDLIMDHFTIEFMRPDWLIELLDDVKPLFSFLDALLYCKEQPTIQYELKKILGGLAMEANLIRLNKNLRTLITEHTPFMTAETEWWCILKIEITALFNFLDMAENELIQYYVSGEERP